MAQRDWNSIIQKLPFDLKAEVISRMIMETEAINSSALFVQPIGIRSRLGQRDIVEYTEETKNEEDFHIVQTSREGLFDILPMMLFISTDGKYEDDIDKSKHITKQAEEARVFLRPFDELIGLLRNEVEITENHYQKDMFGFISKLWFEEKIPLCEELYQRLLLILPYKDNIIGDWELTNQSFTSVLNLPTTIEMIQKQEFNLDEDNRSVLGDFELGFDTVIGAKCQSEESLLKITIKDIDFDILPGYLEEGNLYRFLYEELIATLIPLGIDTEVILEVSTNEKDYFFNFEEALGTVLGVTTVFYQ
jgi:hypothetical protein